MTPSLRLFRRSRRDIGLLAEEINQFAMAVEEYAGREFVPAGLNLDMRESARKRLLFDAARRLRDRIAELIPS